MRVFGDKCLLAFQNELPFSFIFFFFFLPFFLSFFLSHRCTDFSIRECYRAEDALVLVCFRFISFHIVSFRWPWLYGCVWILLCDAWTLARWGSCVCICVCVCVGVLMNDLRN